jgi:hypothetical protein
MLPPKETVPLLMLKETYILSRFKAASLQEGGAT